MLHKLDDIHFSFRKIDSYNKKWNAIFSAKEAGKSTTMVMKMWKAFKKYNGSSVLVRRKVIDISDAYIESIQEILQMFVDEKLTLKYLKGEVQKGIVRVYVDKCSNPEYEGKIFFILIGLSKDKTAFKSMVLKNGYYMFFDEFIYDSAAGEKPIKNEYKKWRELYDTFNRFTKQTYGRNMKCYFLGNPYSVFNPYFINWGVPTNKLKKGAIIVGDDWVVQAYDLSNKLKEKILNENPQYFLLNDDYVKYAFGAIPVNDRNIKIISKKPDNYYLKFVFKIESRYLLIFANNGYGKYEKYWVCDKSLDEYNTTRRKIICLDWNEMSYGTYFFDIENVNTYILLKEALQKQNICYESINSSYLLKGLYNKI